MRLNFIFVFIFTQIMVNAQDFIVTGKVFSQGQPLSSASVFVMGNNSGVTTNAEGQFSIYISNIANPQLVISYLGYKSQIKKISSKTTDLGIIELEWDNKLEEVVVSGTLKPISKLDSPVPIEVYGQTFFKANPTASVFEALENVNGIRPQLNCSICSTGGNSYQRPRGKLYYGYD